ncbi:GNAT family N-acetyltransferase [Methanotrichaceae archaeon M04Ac]|uniref:GNAT family N-acetyltransferase n=1 Tax=Candidatus Methanocrinis alkalitolerans TaxID=3033395 RepID=A0ABT5XH84_9EURY|nr:GNAT family N-acetyltransferase [Candidatus Methanocrinis alkalitolerans]MCR3883484.1 GNAT family N-acetyltransferase [Methanothrix sp.]MDF0593862.1 GNAT family N-acetyltransferase [Candidatus Methanocrinis alkalitolerans]
MTVPLEYRPMRSGEEEVVCDLVSRAFEEFVADGLSPEGREEFYAYSDPHLLIHRSRWNHIILLALAEDEIIGMIELRDDGHVALFFVDGDHQGKGVGGELLRRGIGAAIMRNPGISKATVSSSPNSVAIYERLGFRRLEGLEGDGSIPSIPMVLDLG